MQGTNQLKQLLLCSGLESGTFSAVAAGKTPAKYQSVDDNW